MPISIVAPNGITKSHVAERLQINLKSANENVNEMELTIYFEIDTLLAGEKIAETYWDGAPLVFNCKDDPELNAAMMTIQQRIGEKRYQQLTTPLLP